MRANCESGPSFQASSIPELRHDQTFIAALKRCHAYGPLSTGMAPVSAAIVFSSAVYPGIQCGSFSGLRRIHRMDSQSR